jgi:DNA-binding NarL/FixJ family response regulator
MTLSDGTGALSIRADATIGLAADEMSQRRLESLLTRVGFQVVACGADVAELLEACVEFPPEVVVLACDLALVSRHSALNLLRSELPDRPIVVVAPGDDRSAVRKVLRAGGDGYVPEAAVEEVLPITVQAVLAGHLCVPRSVRHPLAPASFSFREKQVLELVAMGLTNSEIAARLHLSESTIKSHLSSSFRKLGVSSRAEAAATVLDPDSGIDLGVMVVPLEQRSLLLDGSQHNGRAH